MSELLNLCSKTQEQTILSAELINADRNVIEQCIAQPSCQTWFLRKLFRHRHDNDDSLCRQIGQHPNCPMHSAAVIYYCKPELLKGSDREVEIKAAELDPSKYRAWEMLKGYNEKAENLAHYIADVIFKVKTDYYGTSESPYSFCDVAEAKMQTFYRCTPDIVFEKFALHPQTSVIKAAYSPIELIAEELNSMSPEVRGVVARRSDLTADVKLALSQLSYQPALLTLCTIEEEQSCVLAGELNSASIELIKKCLALENCQPWFIDKVFKHCLDSDNSLLPLILQHSNCPWRIAAIIEYCKPELLEGTAVHAEIQLAHFDPATLKEWQQLQMRSAGDGSLADYISKVIFQTKYNYFSEHDSAFTFCDLSQKEMRAFYRSTPQIVIDKFATHKLTPKITAAYEPIELVVAHLPKMNASERAIVVKRDDLTDELKTMLVKDSSKLVKKNLLTHVQLSEDLLLLLAKDSNEPIAEMALKLLPKELKSELNNQKANTDDATVLKDEKSILAYLRLEIAEPKFLAQIATHASPLLCCAATVHKSADDTVWNAAQQRTDLPLWAQLGLAQYSSDSGLLKTYLSSKNYHIQRALCDNQHLTLDQVKVLVKGTKRIEIWAAIANRFIDNNEILNFIISIEGNKSLWLSQLRRCLDSNVTSSELRSIHSKSEGKTLVLSRLIARNPKCTIPIMRLSAYYLPEDIAQNPAYGLKLLEEAKRLKAKPYDDWKAEEYFTQGNGPEFFYDWYLNQENIEDEALKCPRSHHVNPNKLRPMVIMNESAMHRRFIHEQTQTYSDYEYHMLAYLGTPTFKKNMLKVKNLSKEMILELLVDKDKSVQLAAEKIAKQRKLKISHVAPSGKEQAPAKLTLKSLGNKAARVSIAKETKDPDIFKLLVQDKLPDVRAQLAENEHINNDIWMILLSDDVDKISRTALYKKYRRKLDENETVKYQTILQAIVCNTERENRLRTYALKQVSDFEFSAALYQQGEGELDEIIIEQTSKADIIEHAMFAIERGHHKIKPYWIANNPHLTVEQKSRLIRVKPDIISKLFYSCTSGHSLLELYKQFRPLVKKFRESINFDRVRNIELSADEVQKLYNEIEVYDFIGLAHKHLHKLDDQSVISILKSTVNHTQFYTLIDNKNYSTAVQAALLETIELSSSMELLSYFADSHVLPQRLINLHIKSENDDIRESIANFQSLNEKQLSVLMHDENERVWHALFESEKIDQFLLPDWFIRRIAVTRYDYIDFNDHNESLVKELKKRKIALDEIKASSGNALIKQFNAKVTQKQFKLLLTEKGLMENVPKTIEEDEWDDDDSKIIGKRFKTIKYNRLTEIAAEYGYSCYEEYEEHCKIAFYPGKFLELLGLLGISTKP